MGRRTRSVLVQTRTKTMKHLFTSIECDTTVGGYVDPSDHLACAFLFGTSEIPQALEVVHE
jgi:hypothetical protein